MVGLANSIQDAFESTLGQKKIEVFLLGPCPIQKALLYRCGNICGATVTQTSASM
jgi:hypothetical protein